MSLSVCVIASGSSGNAICIQEGHTTILLDAGIPAGEIERRLFGIGVSPASLDGILVSHAHGDHFRSAGTLHRRFDVPVYTEPETDRDIRRSKSIASFRRVERTAPIPSRIGGIEIETFPTRHGGSRSAGRPVGFRFSANGGCVGVATDLGTVTPEVTAGLSECDAAVVEANYEHGWIRRKLHDPSFYYDIPYLGWVLSEDGHLSNEDCASLLTSIAGSRLRHVFLAHMSENHKSPQKDNNSFETARDGVLRRLDEAGAQTPAIHRTYRRGRTEGGPSEMVTIG
jgi:phosphoribosyl 1,2-cyclic phosphodiesterase